MCLLGTTTIVNLCLNVSDFICKCNKKLIVTDLINLISLFVLCKLTLVMFDGEDAKGAHYGKH
jgi:hypothetical protein